MNSFEEEGYHSNFFLLMKCWAVGEIWFFGCYLVWNMREEPRALEGLPKAADC